MRRSAFAALLFAALVAGRADAREVLTQDLDANGHAVYGPSAPALPTSVLRLQDVAVGACAIFSVGTNSTFRCATLGNTASGADLQAPLAPADATLVMPTSSTIRVGAVPNANLATMPARSFKVNATNATATPSDLACTGANQVPQDTGSALVCQQLNYSQLAGTPAAITSLNGDVGATGPGAATATIQPNVVTNAKAAQMAAMTVKANATNATANAADLACPTSGTFLGNLTGTSIACQAVPWSSLSGTTNAITNANLAQAAALTIKANATNATANLQDLSCAVAGTFLGNLSGTSLACAAVPWATVSGTTNAVTNANLAQAPPLSIKANPTNATANDQDLAATGGSQVPMTNAAGTAVSWQPVTPSTTSGLIANWPLTSQRWYCVDGTNGNDANVGLSDTSEADCGTKAKKTIAALAAVFPPNGAGRAVKFVIASGTYSDGLTFLSGIVGYRLIGVIGTGTKANAGAVAFDGSSATDIFAGAITVPGLNSGGYNPTGTPTTTSFGVQLAGGGAPSLPAEPAAPLGWRIRFDSATATVALRGVCTGLSQVSGGNAITVATVLAAAPSTSDVFYIEKAGVIVGDTTIAVGQDVFLTAIGGVDMGGLTIVSGSVVFSLSGATTFNPEGPGAIQVTRIWQGNAAGPNVRMGGGLRVSGAANNSAYGASRWSSVDAATFIGTVEILDPPGPFGIYDGSVFAAGVAIQGAQVAVQNPDNTDVFGSVTSVPTRVIGSGAYVGGTSGVMLRGTSLSFRALGITGVGGVPAIRALGINSIAFVGLVSGSSGNTDVGLDLTSAYGSTFSLQTTPSVTGTAGDVRLCDGTIVSWATAAAGLIDKCGNAVFGSAAFPQFLRDSATNGIVVRTATGTTTAGQLIGAVTTTGTSLATTVNLAAGASVVGQLPLGNQATPTGTGFDHITAGVRDAAARAVDLSGADVTNQLKAASFPALTGAVTTPGGSLADTLNLSASASITGVLALNFLAQGGATTNQALTWNGSAWVPSTLSTAPSGAAGGALTGSYPNPSIANGVVVPSNFAAAPANTLFGNDQASSATPRFIGLGSGLAMDPTGHVLNVTVAGGAPAGAQYWVSGATSLPPNGVRMDLLGNGVVQVSGGMPSAFSAPAQCLAFGAASGSGGLACDGNFGINPTSHTFSATGNVTLQGTTTIGAWTGIGKYTGGVVGVASAGTDYVHSVAGTAGQIQNNGTAADPVLGLVATGVSPGIWIFGSSSFNVNSFGQLTSVSPGTYYTDVQDSGAAVTRESTLDFRAPLHAADSGGSPFRTIITASNFIASGTSHARGLVPDPGPTPGSLKFLREDATFAQPFEAYRDYFIDIPSLQPGDTANRWLATSSDTQVLAGGVVEYGNTEFAVGRVGYDLTIVSSSGTAASMSCWATRNGSAIGGTTLNFTPGATPLGVYTIPLTSTGSFSTSDTYGMACVYNGNFTTGPFGATIAFTIHETLLPPP